MSGSADGRCFRLPVSGTRGRVSTLSFKSSYVAFLYLIGKHAIALPVHHHDRVCLCGLAI